MTPSSSTSRRPLLPLLALAVLGAVLSLAARNDARADDPAPVAITEGAPLTWGFKHSWRVYTGAPAVAGGAAVLADSSQAGYNLTWQFDSGSFDPLSGTTVLRYKGSAHWTKYFYPDNPNVSSSPPGYTGPLDIDLLDVTVVDPVVTISRDSATVSAQATSRQLDTWQLRDFGRVDLVTLDIAGVAPTVAAGTTTWSQIPAATNPSSTVVFGGNYLPGIAVDRLDLSYTGPGGAPDLSESFDLAGTVKLALAQNELLVSPTGHDDPAAGEGSQVAWVDPVGGLIHYRVHDAAGAWTYQAFDLETMAKVGQPLVIPPAEELGLSGFFDSGSGRLYTRDPEAPTQVRYWIRFDREAGHYVRGELATPIDTAPSRQGLSWDPIGERAFEVVREVPPGVGTTAYDQHVWRLKTYVEQPDGNWALTAYDLPGFPTGLNRFGYRRFGVAASDGSLVVPFERLLSQPPGAATPPATMPGAYRIVTKSAGSAEVAPIAGTTVTNDSLLTFSAVAAGPDGQVVLSRQASLAEPSIMQEVDVTPASGPIEAEPRVDLGGFDNATNMSIDPEDGTVWFGGGSSQRLLAVRDGRVVANQFFAERHPTGGAILAAPGHLLYAQSSDGSPGGILSFPPLGIGRFERVGVSPTVLADPGSAAVSLTGSEPSEAVAFSSRAGGEPAPDRQWQVKRPGFSRFSDIPGETGETLDVAAERGMDGSEYRAVYANSAGRNASAVATLSVDYAPRVTFNPVDLAVTDGAAATFEVLGDAHPEPTIAWQRRVAGFWQTIAAGDDNFAIEGASLTVLETNTEQTGALFRAKLTNSVATTYSRAAKLTVTAKAGPPAAGAEPEHVSLTWSGNAEMQKAAPFGGANYFSAGVSDGKEPTYSAADGDVRVFQVSAGGAESPATYATRGAHVGTGGSQLVRLLDGEPTVAANGSTTIGWDGSFSVNFYGGLVPFTLTDPELVIGADGSGSLRADLSGCASSQATPGQCGTLAPVADVTVATFSTVPVDLEHEVAITPDYAGVEVEVPSGVTPQARSIPGWGAWPQPFVDFQIGTGLSSYWYSSGGVFDAAKAPSPILVDFNGLALPAARPKAKPASPPPPAEAPQARIAPRIVAFKRAPVDGRRRASVAMLSCAADGPCRVIVPRRVAMKISGERYWARVLAPRSIEAGGSALVRVKLSEAALVALGKRTARVRVPVVLRTAAGVTKRRAAVRVAAAG